MTDLTCRELVELVTDYLDGALSPGDHARFEEHIAACEGCSEHLDQMRTTVRVLHAAGETPEPGDVPGLDHLLGAFRDWKRERA